MLHQFLSLHHHRFSVASIAASLVTLATIVMLAPTPAHARDSELDHLEFSMGFLGGSRSYQNTGFEVQGGAGAALVGSDARAPFQHAPFDRLATYGLRYDTRLVVNCVRMTAGFDFPFPNTAPGASRYTLGGVDRSVAVDSLRPYELRFGLGVEAPTRPLVPFVDLLGGVHWTSATLLVDGEKVDYRATSFNYSVRAGVRMQVRDWYFVSLAGELGLSGDVRWGTELSVGFTSF